MNPYNNKKILIIGAGELQIPIIKCAKQLGLTVIASDQNPEALAFRYADYTIVADTLNAEESLKKTIEFCQQYGEIHGVVTAGTDASFTVATIANHFHLAGHSPDSAYNASNKITMRKKFAEKNISIPKFAEIDTLEEALEFFEQEQIPCVIKPPQNMGARGISLARTREELESAFFLAQEHNKHNSKILIEEFIDAHELSIDALVHNDTVTITGIADRIIEYAPYFVETGHILPSTLPKDWLERAVHSFRDGIHALGLHHGAAKADLKISKDKTWIIEIAARLSGGFMSAYTFPFSTGIDLNECAIKLALGEALDPLKPQKNLVSVERAIILPAGTVKEIRIPDNILDQEYITHLSFRAEIGDQIIIPKNNVDKSGNIIATAPTRELAFEAIQKALNSINITMDSPSSSEILKQSHENAKVLLKGTCNICRACDGVWCRGQIPGVGGVGTGEGFIQSYQHLREIKILPRYINEVRSVDSSVEMFGYKLSMPVFVAPIGGAKVNYNDAKSELDFQNALVKGAFQAGTMAFIADPAEDSLFPQIAQTILENYGFSIPICKPRVDISGIKRRYQLALSAGAFGLGMDIDGIGLKTFAHAQQSTNPKSLNELQDLIQSYQKPFVVKGILSVHDAEKALQAGATHLIVSSHGGRIGEAFPLPSKVLPEIAHFVQGRATILIDGAIRSGADIIKMLLMGADAVLIGRPVAIHAVGGGHEAVCHYLKNLQADLEKQMLLLGVSTIQELKNSPELLIK